MRTKNGTQLVLVEGKHTHRLNANPMEKRFADAWATYNSDGNVTEYLLSTRLNERQFVPEDTEVDIATIVQWLGSPVGMHFLEEALGFDVRNYTDID